MKKELPRLLVASITLLLLLPSCGGNKGPAPQGEVPAATIKFAEAPSAGITFLSTQFNPVEEAGKMRNAVLRDFPGAVDFRPNDNNYLFTQIDVLLKANPSESILVGALHGDLERLYEDGMLLPLDAVLQGLKDRQFPPNLIGLCKFDENKVYYIPWMQATFVMVANKKALPYLPKGASLNALTYDQLLQWAGNINAKTGMKALGFPAGAKGLMHRFFQGNLYPSFTASTLLKFRSPEARGMWAYFKDLWRFVHPGSLVYSTMAEPLLTGDVWIAWDHTARLVKAFVDRPEDFVAFPAPIGPQGRGFMSVISGLAIPAKVADSKNPAMLIDYLTLPAVQERTLEETGFFPVLAGSAAGAGIPKHLQSLTAAVNTQSTAPRSVPTLLPIGLGDKAGDFNNAYTLAFSQIVLEGKGIAETLDAYAAELQKILDEENARCWLPDVSEKRPCQIE